MVGEIINTTKTKITPFLPMGKKDFAVLCYLVVIIGLGSVVLSICLSFISNSIYSWGYLIFAGVIFLLLIILLRGGTFSFKKDKGKVETYYRGEPQITSETTNFVPTEDEQDAS